MREQIIQLDPHDDYASARDRVGWTQAERVLLVWPKRRGRTRKILTRKLDLQLLQRHAQRMGAQIAFITDDPDVGDHAHELGVPVFDSIDDSHLFPWRSRPARHIEPPPPAVAPRYDPTIEDPIINWPKPRWLQHTAVRWTFSTIVFLIAAGTMATMLALTVPAATVVINPIGQRITARIQVVADPLTTVPDASVGLIEAETRSVEVTGNITVNTSGTIDKATQRAGGLVTFTNQISRPVRIPAGTAVRTTGGTAPVRFVTQQDVELVGITGATADAPVLAIEPGPPGNVDAELVNRVEGPLSLSVAVINQRAMTGGDVVQAAAVTAEDREQAQTQLSDQLRRQGYAELLAGLADNEFAPETGLRIRRVRDRMFSANIGQQADSLTLLLRVEVAITVVDENDAWPVGRAELERRVGDFLTLLPETMRFTRDPQTTTDEDYRVLFEIVAQGAAGSIIDPQDVRNTVRWMRQADAEDLLYNSLPVARRPDINTSPAWFPRLPWLAYQINVEIIPEYSNASFGS